MRMRETRPGDAPGVRRDSRGFVIGGRAMRQARNAADGRRAGVGPKLRFHVLERCGFACFYCGRKPPGVTLHVDHVVPVSRGGTNDEDNLVAACWECNIGKGAALIEEIEVPAVAEPELEQGDDGVPIAYVHLEQDRDLYYWIVDRCPFCGRKHTHGGGKIDGNPRRALGYRISHCGPPNGQDYRLVEVAR